MKLVSWNISAFNTSFAAKGLSIQEKLNEILRLISQETPDVLCIQEATPQFISLVNNSGYSCIASTITHSESCCLFLKASILGLMMKGSAKEMDGVVSVDLRIAKKVIRFASCHLSPFKENEEARIMQLFNFLALQPVDDYIIAGDMNVREDEAKRWLKDFPNLIGRRLKDAWVSTGSDVKAKFTWDSRVNKYFQEGFAFVCRFDRIFVSDNVKCANYKLIGNVPFRGGFLSDHYGLALEFS